jgi:cytochrome c-type biogenesis protein CcmH
MKFRLFSAAILISLVVSALPALAVSAQRPVPSDDDVNAVARELYCPVCENIPLDVCPTQACAQWRDLIRQRLGEGWTKQQIKDYFAAQYGDRVLAEPPQRGMNLLVYILPALFFLLGMYLVYRGIQSLRGPRRTPSVPPPSDPASDPYLSRVEEELEKRK